MKRVPRHIGVIPDGNRRWAQKRELPKENGYDAGLAPGLKLYQLCKEAGVEELTVYGFTKDNTKRPREQTKAFQKACIEAVRLISKEDAELLVVGDTASPLFPEELMPYTRRTIFGSGGIRLNFLVNYGWLWDLEYATKSPPQNDDGFLDMIRSSQISRIDLIIRWGGRNRLSGFLPVQSVYSDIYTLDPYWPDFKSQHFHDALKWYQTQDITLGG
jgi:undecaprenyl diphosphate synthase